MDPLHSLSDPEKSQIALAKELTSSLWTFNSIAESRIRHILFESRFQNLSLEPLNKKSKVVFLSIIQTEPYEENAIPSSSVNRKEPFIKHLISAIEETKASCLVDTFLTFMRQVLKEEKRELENPKYLKKSLKQLRKRNARMDRSPPNEQRKAFLTSIPKKTFALYKKRFPEEFKSWNQTPLQFIRQMLECLFND